jgi:tetratricopeptide (TPR) repeat protein
LGGTSPNGWSGEIVEHYERAGLKERAVPYQVHAGDTARRRYANETAIEYYRRALPYLPDAERVSVMLKLGQVLEFVGKWDEAESLYRQALELEEKLNDTRVRAQCEITLGILLHRKGLDVQALKWFECAKYDFDLVGDSEGVGNVLENMGLVYHRQGDSSRALEYHQQHLGIATKLNNQYEVSQALGNIGQVYWGLANYERALRFYDQQLAIAKETGDRLGSSRALGRRGVVFREQGALGRALENFQEQLRLSNEIGDELGASHAIGNIGRVYYEQGDYPQAFAQAARQLQLAQSFGARREVSQAIRAIGLIYYQRGDLAGAGRWLLQSLQLALEVGGRRDIINTLGSLADSYSLGERYRDAEPLYVRTRALLRTLNVPYKMCENLYQNAHMFFRQKEFAKAQPLLAESSRIAEEIGRKDIEFKSKVLFLQVRAALVPSARASSIKKLEALLAETPDDKGQAALYYALWCLDNDRMVWRKAAVKLYRKLYTKTAKWTYRRRLEELGNSRLPDPPALPEVPIIEPEQPLSLEALLMRVDELIVKPKPLKQARQA